MASILVVCTGNVCRSPLAEGFLRDALERRFGSDAPLVASAGTWGWEGSPAVDETVIVAAERGVDISGHIARRLLPEHVDAADLVLAMAGEHRAAVASAVPGAGGRTFTLKELVRLLEGLPSTGGPGGAPPGRLPIRVAQADALRRSGFRGDPGDEDVPDPLGHPLDDFRSVAEEILAWCGRLTEGLFGRAPASAPVRVEE